MALTSIRLKEAWNWGGLSFRELVVRTYQAMDQHDTLNHAAVVAFYAVYSSGVLLALAALVDDPSPLLESAAVAGARLSYPIPRHLSWIDA